jgi:hypothetical protein
MGDTLELVTIYRAEGDSAQDDANEVCDVLVEAGYTAVVADDSDPDVPAGACDVRVPADQADAAAAAIAGDPGEELDMVPLFEQGTELSEMEALNIKALLEANGIEAMIQGSEMLPSIPFEVQVPQDQLEEAERIVAEAMKEASAGGEASEAVN